MPGTSPWLNGRSNGFGASSDYLVCDIQHVSLPGFPIHQMELVPPYLMKSMGEFNGKHCQAPNTQGALTRARFPTWGPYLILFTLLGKPGEEVGAII